MVIVLQRHIGRKKMLVEYAQKRENIGGNMKSKNGKAWEHDQILMVMIKGFLRKIMNKAVVQDCVLELLHLFIRTETTNNVIIVSI